MFTLAHLSDIHLSPMPRIRRRSLLNKRAFGYVNWHRGRKLVHRREILDLLTHDITERKPDQIAVTGDLVNLGLPDEFVKAAEWLHQLGSADHVTVIPGNHDAYVRLERNRSTGLWQAYMDANLAGEALFPTPNGCFPFLRRFGDVVLIGLSSAIPTGPFLAAGHIGATQRALLAEILEILGAEKLFRVVLIHHPPLPGQSSWRRGLRDADKVCRILREHGAELVLHGHNHEQTVRCLETVSGPAYVIGVPSASEALEGHTPTARYNEYAIDRVDGGWRCEMIGRAVAAEPRHVWEVERRVLRER